MDEKTSHAREVRQMFGRIANRYDLLNRLMTFGMDMGWRLEAIRQLDLQPGQVVLDLGAGTGDISFCIREQHPQVSVIACDFTPEMILVGKKRPQADAISWVVADAMNLPFASEAADGIISGFLLRNTADLNATLAEEYRVCKSGGSVVSLDTTPPQGILKPFIELYLRFGVPLLGRLFAQDASAYVYLPQTTERFLPAEALAERLRAAGYRLVGFVRRNFGTVAIHWGRR